MKLGNIVKGMWNTGRYLFGGAALASAFLAPTLDTLAEESIPATEEDKVIRKPEDTRPKVIFEGPIENEEDPAVDSGDSASLDPSSEDRSILSDFAVSSPDESILSGFDGSILSIIQGKREKKKSETAEFFDKMHVQFGVGYCSNYGSKPIRMFWEESHGEVSVDWKNFDFRYLYQNRIHNKIYDTTPDSNGEWDFSFLDPDYDPGELYSLSRNSRVTQTFYGKIHLGRLYHASGFYELFDWKDSLLPTDPEPYFSDGGGIRGGGSFRVGTEKGTGVEAFVFFSDEDGYEDHPASSPRWIYNKSASLNGFLEGTFFFMLKKNVMQHVTIFAGALSSGGTVEEENILTEDYDIMEPFIGISTRTLGKGFGINALFTVNYENRTSDITRNSLYYYTPFYCCAAFQITDGFSIVASGRYLENKYPGAGIGFHIGDLLSKKSHLVLLDHNLDRGRRLLELDGHNSGNLRTFEDNNSYETMASRIYSYRTAKELGGFLIMQGEVYKGPNCTENQYNYSIEGVFGVMVTNENNGLHNMFGLSVRYIDDQSLHQRVLIELYFNIGLSSSGSNLYFAAGFEAKKDREIEEFKTGSGLGGFAKIGVTF